MRRWCSLTSTPVLEERGRNGTRSPKAMPSPWSVRVDVRFAINTSKLRLYRQGQGSYASFLQIKFSSSSAARRARISSSGIFFAHAFIEVLM